MVPVSMNGLRLRFRSNCSKLSIKSVLLNTDRVYYYQMSHQHKCAACGESVACFLSAMCPCPGAGTDKRSVP